MAATERTVPGWVDREEYPFATQHLELPAGRMSYVDEGRGKPVLFVHGTPTWSFLYRHLIKGLSGEYRCIAPDNLGFGLSDKPEGFGYRPEDHAANLRAFIERLGLEDVTLVAHDFGGPIALSYAVERPENARALVLFNTWMWSLRGNKRVARGARLLGGPLGGVLYRRMNFSAGVLMKTLYGDKGKLTPEIHAQYKAPFPTPGDRQSTATLARELLGSSEWYEGLWERRDRIAEKPALLLWGLKDPGFGGELGRWQEALPKARVVTFPDTGHFVQEEQGEALVPVVADFLRALP